MAKAVQDGPIDPKKYAQASVKILHLLKQPTEYNRSLPELFRELMAKEDWPTLMRRTAERSFCILNGGPSWREVLKARYSGLESAMLCSAVVNVVNDQFRASTDVDKLYDLAKTQKARWHGQIRKYKPDIVVCGGTFNPAWKALEKPEYYTTSAGMEYFFDPGLVGCIYIEMPHPSVRYPMAMVYTYLAANVSEILTRRKRHRTGTRHV